MARGEGRFQAKATLRVRPLLTKGSERKVRVASRLLNDHPGILQYLAIHPVEIDSLAILRCKRPIRPVALTVGQCFPFCVVPLNYWRHKVPGGRIVPEQRGFCPHHEYLWIGGRMSS